MGRDGKKMAMRARRGESCDAGSGMFLARPLHVGISAAAQPVRPYARDPQGVFALPQGGQIYLPQNAGLVDMR
jgi:hypothetical protein